MNKDDTTGKIVMNSVEKARPKLDRPRLSEELERSLDGSERKSAACYAGLEMLSHKARKLAKQIDEAEAVPEEIEKEDSLVQHVEDLRTKARP